ncbi:MAG: hydroxyacylglutathione hydrolase [Simkaniaceae bacterium]
MELWKNTADGIEVYLHLIKILSDNYVYILIWPGHAIVIDPGETDPIMEFLHEKNLTVSGVLNTHHHKDHTDGNCALKKKYDCPVIGPDDDRIPCLDQKVGEEELIVGPFGIDVIPSPGHTSTHLVYFLPQFKLLFSGDTLFGAGCGRLFEGTAKELYSSLQKISSLPEETLIFCGHEYTEKNLEFALTLEPDNEDIIKRLDQVRELLSKGLPSVPFTLAEEKKTNPFLRSHLAAIKKAIDMEDATEIEIFERLREMRNGF